MQSEPLPLFLYLNVDNHKAISTDLGNYVVKHTDLLASKPWRNFSKLEVSHVLEHVPLLKDFCEQKMLDPVFMAVTIMSPNGGEDMHADSDRPWVRILWPVTNCIGSLTKLYHVSKNFYYEDNDKDISFVPFYFVKENTAVQQVGSFELRQPVVFDTSEFHSIHRVPNSSGPRISFSMGFDRDLDISNSMQAWLNF
jgi:hypothetical protein